LKSTGSAWQLQLDRVIRRVGEILLRSEVALRRLHRGVVEQQLPCRGVALNRRHG